MTGKSEWQGAVGKGWAREWQRTDRSFAALTSVLVERILARRPAHSILDIGCGAGELSLKIAAEWPESRIVGVDVSNELIETARSRIPSGARVAFQSADAAGWRDDLFRPDLLISRHGVMFFDDPLAAFRHFADVSGPGARLVFSCFRDRADNDWASAIGQLLPAGPPFDPIAPGPFAFADSARVTDILAKAGWHKVQHEAVDFSYVAGSGDDPVSDALDFFSSIGPAAPVIRALEGSAKIDFLLALRALAQAHFKDGAIRFSAAAWIVTAQKLD